ncbi:MAG: Gfo/Idh/MocA family oxidoreductase [Pseudolabrys sp.]
MSRLRVAGVGAGYFSQFHYDAWTRMDDVELVGLCDLDAARASQAAARWSAPQSFTNAAEMLDRLKPDLVDIITPPAAHLSLIQLAADRRINAICQKTFCLSLAEARQAVQTAETATILLVVHENFRFQPWYGEIKRQLVSGELGQVYQATFRLRPGDGQGADAYLDRQPYFQTMERFLVHETAIHFVDTFRFLFGEVAGVFADLRRLNPVIAGEDSGIVIFRHASGVRAVFDGNRLIDHPAQNKRLTMGEMIIEGERAVLRLDGDGNLFLRPLHSNTWQPIAFEKSEAGFGGDSVYRLQRHVVDHLQGRRPVVNMARDYIANLVVEEAIYKSAANRRVEDIAP